MTGIAFSYQDFSFFSAPFSGGVNVQVAFPSATPSRITIETRLDASHRWTRLRSLTVSSSLLFAIRHASDGQQFRLRSSSIAGRPTASLSPISDGSSPSDLSAIKSRLADLEEGNEPLVLFINPETGNLEQEGISSGSFGIDQDSGILYFDS